MSIILLAITTLQLVLLLVLVAVFILTLIFAWFLLRSGKSDSRFAPPSELELLFKERFASGCSHKSWLTWLGGANNALTVTVTNREVAISINSLLKVFAASLDLVHIIPHGDICRVDRKGSRVTFDFELPNGQIRRFTLRLRRAQEFLDVIEPLVDLEG
ncbi:hypothetical protein [Adhaeretor mobilis]|uniref:Uncharacterized protein n=1 Tax=Adhaeretor mobilis TaxID=1930276 RepID=A0A517MYY2_9BACT|nr:hypothetical protein [Adhaeretor mobilis]QDT00093.1 hypothetical protein HG15A2_34280 [Adhaeretor mobilis]